MSHQDLHDFSAIYTSFFLFSSPTPPLLLLFLWGFFLGFFFVVVVVVVRFPFRFDLPNFDNADFPDFPAVNMIAHELVRRFFCQIGKHDHMAFR